MTSHRVLWMLSEASADGLVSFVEGSALDDDGELLQPKRSLLAKPTVDLLLSFKRGAPAACPSFKAARLWVCLSNPSVWPLLSGSQPRLAALTFRYVSREQILLP